MLNARRFARLAPLAVLAAPALAHADEPLPPNATVVVVAPPQAPVPYAAPQIAPPALAPTGPQQNEDWNNVSHINGQIVPVGDRTQYLYKFKKTNISTNPIGWIFGFYGVSVSHAVHDNVAIRADANILSFDHSTGYELGVSLPIYFRRAYSGPFIEPGLITRGLTHDDDVYCSGSTTCGTQTRTETMVGPEVLFGWHWSFDSGLNVAAAFGAARNLKTPGMDEYGGLSEKVQPAGYFRVGYEF